jgi:hypothetical protein
MGFFKKIFSKNETLLECPRCLGKGYVDQEDIIRLNQELRWVPGNCAYCNAKGKVSQDKISKLPPDTSYLVNNLSDKEREDIFNADPFALERGKYHDNMFKTLVEQINYLHFECGLDTLRIATFFMLGNEENINFDKEKLDFIDFTEKVIEKYSKN